MIESFDTIFYTAIFILPGFLMCKIIDASNPVHKTEYGVYVLRCLLLSIVNCACSSWSFNLTLKLKEYGDTVYWITLLVTEILMCCIIAYVVALFKQKQLIRKLFRKLGLNTLNSIPTAWDYSLSRNEPKFVVVTMEDGNQIYGYYGCNSFASSEPDERDLFLEKTYIFENDQWKELPYSSGILIPKDRISTIEFMETYKNE